MITLFIAIVGNLMDAILTAIAVCYMGKRELNPLMRWAADKVLVLIGIKLIAIGWIWHNRKRYGTSPLISIALVGIIATIWNTFVILRSE